MKERLALALLGGWLAGTFIFAWAATVNFRTVDRLLGAATPEFKRVLEPLGREQGRMLLRHLVSEINRCYFRWWNLTQIVLGVAILGLLFGTGRRWPLLLVGLMLALVILYTLAITPTITNLGRSLDFAPRAAPPPELRRFWLYHGLYMALDLVKLGAGLALLVLLLFQSTRSD